MKILHINDNYAYLGGTERYLLDICSALEQMGHQIGIISSSERQHISIPGRQEYFLKPSYGLRSGQTLWRVYREIIEKENPDIIHLHNTHYFISPLITKRLWNLKPTVKFVHDARFFCPSLGRKVIPKSNELCSYPVGRSCFNRKGCYPFHADGGNIFDNIHKFLCVSAELWVSRMLDCSIVASQYMYDELLRNKFDSKKVRKIPCFTNKGFVELHHQEDNRLILCVGRFEGGKNLLHVIEALNYLKDQQWRVEVIGDGQFIKESKDLSRRFGFEHKITFVGRLSETEIDSTYQRCSVVVMPSVTPESFGLVGIEAMAYGKPVIAFDAGGVREWMVDGRTGFLVKRGDVKELANRVAQLLGDKWLAKRMGEQGKARVDRYYRQEMHLKELLDVYQEAINHRAKAGLPG